MTDWTALAAQKAWEGFWYTFGAGLMLTLGLASGILQKLRGWWEKQRPKVVQSADALKDSLKLP